MKTTKTLTKEIDTILEPAYILIEDVGHGRRDVVVIKDGMLDEIVALGIEDVEVSVCLTGFLIGISWYQGQVKACPTL